MSECKPKCFVCSKTIAITHRFINCSACPNKAHIKCNDTDVTSFNEMKSGNTAQFCLSCKNKQVAKNKCNICNKTIAKNHRHISCSHCKEKTHINCNRTDIDTYLQHTNEQLPLNCIKCISSLTESSSLLPFFNISNTVFIAMNKEIDLGPKEKVPCGICTRTIGIKHRKIKCEICSECIHIKCSQIDTKTYNLMAEGSLPQQCIRCKPDNFQLEEIISCSACKRKIPNNHKYLDCSICHSSIHIKCNKTDAKSYQKIKSENKKIICVNCKVDCIPFQSLTDLEFQATCKGIETNIETLEDISFTSTSLRSFFHEINKTNPFENHPLDKHDTTDDDAFLIDCKYMDICSYNLKTDPNKFSIFHTNIGSIEKHIEELRTTINSIPDFKFDVLAITETKIKKNTKPKVSLQIKGYKYYHVDTESEKGGSLIYISDTIKVWWEEI